jgi:hypothetical protein
MCLNASRRKQAERFQRIAILGICKDGFARASRENTMGEAQGNGWVFRKRMTNSTRDRRVADRLLIRLLDELDRSALTAVSAFGRRALVPVMRDTGIHYS